MTRFEKTIKELAKNVAIEMHDCIASGYDRMSYEQDYGNTTIMVEVELVGTIFSIDVVDVWIERDNSEHQSPKVIEAIKRALPNWWDVRQQVEEENRCYELQTQYMMN